MADLPAEVSATVDAEIAELQGQMADTHAWHQPSNQPARDRIQQLYEQQESGTPPAAPHDATALRVAKHEGMMTDAKGEYWKSPELQNEYRELVTVEDAGGPEGMLDEVGQRMDAALGASLDGVTAAFLGLDDTLQQSIALELAQPAPTANPAPTEDLTLFTMTDHGNILTSRWGADSAQQLGVVMSRVERFEASLSPTDFDNWLDFFHNRISAQERAAILGEIAQ